MALIESEELKRDINRCFDMQDLYLPFWFEKLVDEQPIQAESDFGYAIRMVKSGHKMTRNGWNGKNQYIGLAMNISYETDDMEVAAFHKDIGSRAIVFTGTRGSQVGWLASQADMLAEDWKEYDGGIQ